MRVLELYSGIGGMHYALAESHVPGEIVAAVDINTVANEVYKHNFPGVRNINRNIGSLSIKEIEDMNIDSIFMSPPCQPFTRVGLQKDSEDNRSSSLFHVLKIIPQIKTLKHILVENVKGFENSNTRYKLITCLEQANFNWTEFILSPCQMGVPNTRRRYYLLAKKKDLWFRYENSKTIDSRMPEDLITSLPNIYYRQFTKDDFDGENIKSPEKCYRLERIIDNTADTDNYALPDKILQKRASVLDVRTPASRGSCCFTKAYGRYVEGTGSIFTPFPQEMVDEAFVEYQKLRNSSNDSLKPLMALKLRFFTPREISRLMCFPESFEFPKNITDKQKYRLLGNSINVYVVSCLIDLLNMSDK